MFPTILCVEVFYVEVSCSFFLEVSCWLWNFHSTTMMEWLVQVWNEAEENCTSWRDIFYINILKDLTGVENRGWNKRKLWDLFFPDDVNCILAYHPVVDHNDFCS